jgi:hypothetical protein
MRLKDFWDSGQSVRFRTIEIEADVKVLVMGKNVLINFCFI